MERALGRKLDAPVGALLRLFTMVLDWWVFLGDQVYDPMEPSGLLRSLGTLLSSREVLELATHYWLSCSKVNEVWLPRHCAQTLYSLSWETRGWSYLP